MTRYAENDEQKTAELVAQLDLDTTWLRHRGRAAELDRLLLRGATSSELAEVRVSWKGHITHLRQVHRVTVLEPSPGFWRIAQPGTGLPHASSTSLGDDSLKEDSDYEDGRDLDLASDTSVLEDRYFRLEETARALSALAQAGLLDNPLIKDSVGMLIRQASESRHWHTCAHYRSKDAAELIRREHLKTAHEYQKFCRGNLRHEHVVPNNVIYKMLCTQKLTKVDEIAELLKRLCIRATITRDEDAKLNHGGFASAMPEDFMNGRDQNPLARYVAVGLADNLEKRPHDRLWHEVQ